MIGMERKQEDAEILRVKYLENFVQKVQNENQTEVQNLDQKMVQKGICEFDGINGSQRVQKEVVTQFPGGICEFSRI